MEMSVLETGLQLMVLPTTAFRTIHPILVFRVFFAVPDLVPLIRGSFSKPCPPDLGNALDDPNSSILTHG